MVVHDKCQDGISMCKNQIFIYCCPSNIAVLTVFHCSDSACNLMGIYLFF